MSGKHNQCLEFKGIIQIANSTLNRYDFVLFYSNCFTSHEHLHFHALKRMTTRENHQPPLCNLGLSILLTLLWCPHPPQPKCSFNAQPSWKYPDLSQPQLLSWASDLHIQIPPTVLQKAHPTWPTIAPTMCPHACCPSSKASHLMVTPAAQGGPKGVILHTVSLSHSLSLSLSLSLSHTHTHTHTVIMPSLLVREPFILNRGAIILNSSIKWESGVKVVEMNEFL